MQRKVERGKHAGQAPCQRRVGQCGHVCCPCAQTPGIDIDDSVHSNHPRTWLSPILLNKSHHHCATATSLALCTAAQVAYKMPGIGNDTKYLQELVGEALARGCAACIAAQPNDPVDYLGQWLLR